MSAVLAAVLSRELAPVTGPAGYRLRALDATSLSGPGATGTDWRVHTLADPTTGRLVAVEVTDRFQGEGFARVPLQSGDLVLADRGYAHARGIRAAVRAQADVVVRINLETIRLDDAAGQRALPAALAAQVPTVGPVEVALGWPEPPAPTASRKSWAVAHALSGTRVRVAAIRPRPGAPIIWVLATAPADRVDTALLLEGYRLRWQIDFRFKRLTSWLDFGALPARPDPWARSWILARLLAAALIDQLVHTEPAFPPGATASEPADTRHPRRWTLCQFGRVILTGAILGVLPLVVLEAAAVRDRWATTSRRRRRTHLPFVPT